MRSEPILSTCSALTPEIPVRLRYISPVITVIGDAMLDGWWHGHSERMAREAPAPVVALRKKLFVPGGAANTAMNVASLGARVRFVGLVGTDESGLRLRDQLDEAGIDISGLILHPAVKTITKTRIILGDQVLARLDEAQPGEYPQDALEQVAEAVARATSGVAAQLVCDYRTGMLRGPVASAVIAQPHRPPLTVVDAHDPAEWAALRPDIVTPNAEETAQLVGGTLNRSTDRVQTVLERAPELFERTGAHSVIVTLDRDGTVMMEPDGRQYRTWAQPAADKQASGAGDTFVAALAVGRASGLPLTTSIDLAQCAADVVVSRFGTSVCSTTDLVTHLSQFADGALENDELVRQLDEQRNAGKRIVLTNGCFDVLHRGHTAYLNQAKRLGDVLVVAVNSDDSVRRLKGDGRPINTAADRAGVLAALSCVDYVTVFDADTPSALIERIRPDIYAKGGDYRAEDMAETAVVRGYGGDVRILDYLPAHSTTAVVKRIRSHDATRHESGRHESERTGSA
ncbi:D-glycero-beta-D-manno-heptose 1-phosphate adenylyltransferase [Leifsonia sp. SIMBA_070]|uniref:D-glycero-beta-D-manno-heptose 1-phosphate adenylyltransferase n=1 Tax=Leifsonia sp. SIMBA_070 TaxID=3085810 RepID=UPI00397CCDF3